MIRKQQNNKSYNQNNRNNFKNYSNNKTIKTNNPSAAVKMNGLPRKT